MIQSPAQNPSPEQDKNRQPGAMNQPLTEAQKKAKADEAAGQGSKS
jgi:hypothetical protein